MFLMSQDIGEGKADQDIEYVFTLCPKTEFDLGTDLKGEDDQKETPIIPFFDNSTFRCGRDGKIENSCVIKGGYYQVIFDDDFWWINNVTFTGVSFEGNQHISVLGFGHPQTDIKFENCRWKDNIAGDYLVAIYWDEFIRAGFEPSKRYVRRINALTDKRKLGSYLAQRDRFARQPRALQGDTAMYAGFAQCEFTDNTLEKAGILNQGGRLELSGCTFESNRALVVVANIQDAQLTVHSSTSFSTNNDKYGPVFLDSSSELKYLSEDTVGQGNVGSGACQGIFVEKAGFDCLFSTDCDGNCCEFGLSTCDHIEAEEDVEVLAKETATTPASDYSGRACGPSCVAASVLVPVAAIVIIALGVRYVRRRQSGIELAASDAPEPVSGEGQVYML
eukprot:CAMPEP_0197450112 /NCGR_PEP_ID=MMETSP1175-20131217/24062_1 /TAXON_ID=1003142 /ORGANISM="Triceratium dubium, Strain CCMP147" /LENGTH=390 /DNA_ID=CAMNT_0042982455 /DNA_START=210 /DNA_END=1382 /DNA_ORIENTATION=-